MDPYVALQPLPLLQSRGYIGKRRRQKQQQQQMLWSHRLMQDVCRQPWQHDVSLDCHLRLQDACDHVGPAGLLITAAGVKASPLHVLT